jgi:hypothetical protein
MNSSLMSKNFMQANTDLQQLKLAKKVIFECDSKTATSESINQVDGNIIKRGTLSLQGGKC